MATDDRIQHAGLAHKVMPAEAAAEFIGPGDTVGMNGFTGSGYPKAVPEALARPISASHAAGTPFRINVCTGASTCRTSRSWPGKASSARSTSPSSRSAGSRPRAT